jgi:protein SDA1
LKYGQRKAASGVEGSDLLVAYESRKAAKKLAVDDDSDDDEDGTGVEPMNDEEEEVVVDEDMGEWQDVEEGDGDIEINSDDEGEAPKLVPLDADGNPIAAADDGKDVDGVLDVSKMSVEARDKLKQEVSANRIFTAADFTRMRKLVDRETRAKRDPRENARRKRAIARGEDYDELSDDDDSDDEAIHISGAVNPGDIMADAKRKRQGKAERLEGILAGRDKFESNDRDGGSTNTEKKRKKNFMMSKWSLGARFKGNGKTTLRVARKDEANRQNKKRRRKM